jgi:hypothetical protein
MVDARCPDPVTNKHSGRSPTAALRCCFLLPPPRRSFLARFQKSGGRLLLLPHPGRRRSWSSFELLMPNRPNAQKAQLAAGPIRFLQKRTHITFVYLCLGLYDVTSNVFTHQMHLSTGSPRCLEKLRTVNREKTPNHRAERIGEDIDPFHFGRTGRLETPIDNCSGARRTGARTPVPSWSSAAPRGQGDRTCIKPTSHCAGTNVPSSGSSPSAQRRPNEACTPSALIRTSAFTITMRPQHISPPSCGPRAVAAVEDDLPFDVRCVLGSVPESCRARCWIHTNACRPKPAHLAPRSLTAASVPFGVVVVTAIGPHARATAARSSPPQPRRIPRKRRQCRGGWRRRWYHRCCQ